MGEYFKMEVINNLIGSIIVVYCVISLFVNNYPEIGMFLLGLYGINTTNMRND